MRVFFDTNILLDIVEQRAPHFQSSKDALLVCGSRGVEILLAWHSLSNAFYIYGRKAGKSKALEALREALEYMSVITVGHIEALRAFELGFTDLEDAMQAAAAETAQADFLITRDTAGFSGSPVPVLSPGQFVARMGTQP
jgi:predicted nucleic acid-binding protein